jgi:TRAP-type uncharacterized transport system fused permease subunit
MQAGVNQWVVHFFAFFIAVFGELTPPTSITAAITSKIAQASFYSTLGRAVQICVSLFTLMVGVFVHPELVIKPGFDQMGAAYLILVATLGITFSLQASYSESRPVDLAVRVALAAMSLFILLSYNDIASDIVSVGVLAVIAYWLTVRRKLMTQVGPDTVTLDDALATPISDASLGRMS